MPMFLKNQWVEWARDWGLAHQPMKAFQHTERVAGERNGYLIRIGWGTDRNPGLITCVRFPRAADPGRIRQALIDDASLDTLPGKGSGRRKMAIETGPPKAFRWGRRPEFVLTNNSLVWQRTFPWSTPKAARVQSWVDALVAAIARVTPGFAGRCETCATGEARQYVLVDDMPTMMCTSCQQRLRAEGDMADRTYEMIEVRHLPGTVLGLGAALGCAVAWAGIGALTERIFAAAAVGIGAFVAFAYRHGAGRVDGAGRVIGGSLTLLSVVVGEVLLLTWWVSKAMPNIGFNLEIGWLSYLKIWVEAPGQEAVPMLFGLVGAWVATRALQRPKLHARIEPAGSGGEKERAA
jgi:hypothetical protein